VKKNNRQCKSDTS